MTLDDITNFFEISGNLGTAGQPGRAQFAEISAAGYEAVINLALVDSQNAIPEEGALVQSLGMEYIHIPVIWAEPKDADLDAFLAAMRRLQGRKVFAHCVLNMRVSVFTYLYRVTCLALDREEAWWDVLSIWEPDPTWQTFINHSLERLAGEEKKV